MASDIALAVADGARRMGPMRNSPLSGGQHRPRPSAWLEPVDVTGRIGAGQKGDFRSNGGSGVDDFLSC
jgi:hypothetical protein